MQRYVLGFAFDDIGRLALILKDHPADQAGRWNGIGGKVEKDENLLQAMSREFFEETGVRTQANDWSLKGEIEGTWGHVFVYTITHPDIRKVKTAEKELVALFPTYSLPTNMLDNLLAMISLVQIPRNYAPRTFKLTY